MFLFLRLTVLHNKYLMSIHLALQINQPCPAAFDRV